MSTLEWLRSRFRRPFELVCPFHRGDVLLAIQVAHTLRALGLRVRLHTSSALKSWVEAFDCAFPVNFLSTPLVGAEDTASGVASALAEVTALDDASPRLVRFHPAASLRFSGTHLLEYVFDQFGLGASPPPIRNLGPRLEPGDVLWARDELRPWGPRAVLLQSRGGWSLKTLPPSVGLELQRQAARLGAKLVQIGGPDDPREEFCDGSLLGDFPLSKWRALFEQATAVFSVDSWTAHFAAILDRPQAVFYGPTDARLIHSKRFFAEQSSPSVVIDSSVPCSPCDSLTCVAYPGATHCAGYRTGELRTLESLLRSDARNSAAS